ncbi:hypothetical protein JYA63_10320 [Fictibacillus nanhaiensis]|uniref:Uncharacterized protein n=1 Tax=Fictibacillus nanhaiensis TaxID=742169 RepID=A0ABS2ZR59_9BACL|nr:hypothetical protein [Fictibacillus nanhaiensis]
MEDKLQHLKKHMDQRLYRYIKLNSQMEEHILQRIRENKTVKPSYYFVKDLMITAIVLLFMTTSIPFLVSKSGSTASTSYMSIPYLTKAENLAKQKGLTEEIFNLKQSENSFSMEVMISEKGEISDYKKDVEEVLTTYSRLYQKLYPHRKNIWDIKNVTVYLSTYREHPTSNDNRNVDYYLLIAHKPAGSINIEWSIPEDE